MAALLQLNVDQSNLQFNINTICIKWQQSTCLTIIIKFIMETSINIQLKNCINYLTTWYSFKIMFLFISNENKIIFYHYNNIYIIFIVIITLVIVVLVFLNRYFDNLGIIFQHKYIINR
eukprot:33480_1